MNDGIQQCQSVSAMLNRCITPIWWTGFVRRALIRPAVLGVLLAAMAMSIHALDSQAKMGSVRPTVIEMYESTPDTFEVPRYLGVVPNRLAQIDSHRVQDAPEIERIVAAFEMLDRLEDMWWVGSQTSRDCSDSAGLKANAKVIRLNLTTNVEEAAGANESGSWRICRANIDGVVPCDYVLYESDDGAAGAYCLTAFIRSNGLITRQLLCREIRGMGNCLYRRSYSLPTEFMKKTRLSFNLDSLFIQDIDTDGRDDILLVCSFWPDEDDDFMSHESLLPVPYFWNGSYLSCNTAKTSAYMRGLANLLGLLDPYDSAAISHEISTFEGDPRFDFQDSAGNLRKLSR